MTANCPTAATKPRLAPPCKWVEGLQTAVLVWFVAHGRDLPWRNTTNPFHILIAEVLLRRTQARRVVLPYLEFVECYPDPQALANADTNWLRGSFRPLGLLKRVDWLVQAAKIIVSEYHAEVPQNLDALLKLPGLGPYSARAILCLAFGYPVPMVDESSGRLLRRVLGLDHKGPSHSDRQLLASAEGLLPDGGSRAFNLGLLDIASCCCRAGLPDCRQCPLLSFCASSNIQQTSAPAGDCRA